MGEILSMFGKLKKEKAKAFREAINGPGEPPTLAEMAQWKEAATKRLISKMTNQIAQQTQRIKQLEAKLKEAGIPLPPQ